MCACESYIADETGKLAINSDLYQRFEKRAAVDVLCTVLHTSSYVSPSRAPRRCERRGLPNAYICAIDVYHVHIYTYWLLCIVIRAVLVKCTGRDG